MKTLFSFPSLEQRQHVEKVLPAIPGRGLRRDAVLGTVGHHQSEVVPLHLAVRLPLFVPRQRFAVLLPGLPADVERLPSHRHQVPFVRGIKEQSGPDQVACYAW
jgi:hypothetical protein